VWLGPFFVCLVLLSVRDKDGRDGLAWIWLGVIVVAYTFLNKDNFKPLDKYFLVLIPPMALVISNFLSKFRWRRRHLVLLGVVFVLIFSVFVGLNKSSGEFMPFYPKADYISRATALDWSFYLPITGSSGPAGFYIVFSAVVTAFGLGGVLMLLAMMLHNRKGFSIILVMLLSVSLAYNAFFAQEYLFSSTAPSANRVGKELIGYVQSNNLEQPLFVFRDKAFKYYLLDQYQGMKIINFDMENNEVKVDEVTSAGSTVVVLDFPRLNRDGLLWQALMGCERIKSFSDKGVEMGFVFEC